MLVIGVTIKIDILHGLSIIINIFQYLILILPVNPFPNSYNENCKQKNDPQNSVSFEGDSQDISNEVVVV